MSLHNMNVTRSGLQLCLSDYRDGNVTSHAGKRIRLRYLLYLEMTNSNYQLILFERKVSRQEIKNKQHDTMCCTHRKPRSDPSKSNLSLLHTGQREY
jgi:hypothetical protein